MRVRHTLWPSLSGCLPLAGGWAEMRHGWAPEGSAAHYPCWVSSSNWVCQSLASPLSSPAASTVGTRRCLVRQAMHLCRTCSKYNYNHRSVQPRPYHRAAAPSGPSALDPGSRSSAPAKQRAGWQGGEPQAQAVRRRRSPTRAWMEGIPQALVNAEPGTLLLSLPLRPLCQLLPTP